MLIVVTGLSGVGKTSIMKASSIRRQIFLDEWVKQKLYYKWQKGYRLIKKHFGSDYVTFWKVDVPQLRDLLTNEPAKLVELNQLIFPLVQKKLYALSDTSKNYVVEQATYLNYERHFHHFYKKVILVKRDPLLARPKNNFVKLQDIEYDLLIHNNQALEVAVAKYEKFVNDAFKA